MTVSFWRCIMEWLMWVRDIGGVRSGGVSLMVYQMLNLSYINQLLVHHTLLSSIHPFHYIFYTLLYSTFHVRIIYLIWSRSHYLVFIFEFMTLYVFLSFFLVCCLANCAKDNRSWNMIFFLHKIPRNQNRLITGNGERCWIIISSGDIVCRQQAGLVITCF